MPYIPSTLRIFHPNTQRDFCVENDSEQPIQIQCFAGFPTDAANGASHATAVRWAADCDLSPGSYGSTDIQNVPVPSVTVVGLSYRGRGGRAWKVVDRGFLFDLREGALLELLMNGAGRFERGTLEGPFIWINDGGLRLVRVDSEPHRIATLGKAPRVTISLPEQGNIFQVKNNKYVTKISPTAQKDEVWLYTDSVPTSLNGAFLADALLGGHMKSPTKRPTLPVDSFIGTVQPDIDNLVECLCYKILTETVEWTTVSYNLFRSLVRYSGASKKLHPLITFLEGIAAMQYCMTGAKNSMSEEELSRFYFTTVRTYTYNTPTKGTHIVPFRVYTTNMETRDEVLKAGFVEVDSNPSPACNHCRELWSYRAHTLSKFVNPQYPKHLADCDTHPVAVRIANAKMLKPDLLAKFALAEEYFELIRPPMPTWGATSLNIGDIVKSRVQSSNSKLIPSFSKFQY